MKEWRTRPFVFNPGFCLRISAHPILPSLPFLNLSQHRAIELTVQQLTDSVIKMYQNGDAKLYDTILAEYNMAERERQQNGPKAVGVAQLVQK